MNMSASAVEPLNQSELLAFEEGAREELIGMPLDYPKRHGSPELKHRIANRYTNVTEDGVILTAGLDEALGLLFVSMVEPGDRVVVLHPCYPPHLQIPAWRGAEVVKWPARPQLNWVPDLNHLRDVVAQPTKLIVTTFPQNPTGFMPDSSYEAELLDIVERCGAVLVSDEIYAGLPSGSTAELSNLADRHDRVISLHGLSKTFGLPGLRLGWLAARDPRLLNQVLSAQNFFNAYVPAPTDLLANLALRSEIAILERNSTIIANTKAFAHDFFSRHGNLFEYQEPTIGALCFPRWNGPGGTSQLSRRLLEDWKLVCAPSLCFDAGDDNFRVGLGRKNLPIALDRFERFLETV